MEVCPLSRGVILPSGATPIRLITRRLSLFPSSFARTPIGSPHGSLSHSGEIRGYHVPQLRLDGLGLAYTPVAQRLRWRTLEPPPWLLTFWFKPLSRFGLSDLTTLAAIHIR